MLYDLYVTYYISSPVDVRLTMQTEMLLQNLTLVLFCLGVVGIVFPWFLITILPLGVFLWLIRRVSRSVYHHQPQSLKFKQIFCTLHFISPCCW